MRYLLALLFCLMNLEGGETMEKPVVTIKTNKGDIKVELRQDKAPTTVKNFLDYVDQDFYDGTIFHRVIEGFMIQGGGFTKEMQQKKTKDEIKNEADNGLRNKRGAIAMARTNVVDSATSQFFINVVDNPFLDYQGPSQYGYCVFGEVVSGMDVVDQIRKVKTSSNGMHQDVPMEPVVILDVTRE